MVKKLNIYSSGKGWQGQQSEPHAAGSLNVANHADGDHGRGLDDGDGLDHLLLVVLGTGTIHLTDNVGHTGLRYNKLSKIMDEKI